MPQVMMGQPSDELDSSDDEDQFPHNSVFSDQRATNTGSGTTGSRTRANRFDQMLKVSRRSRGSHSPL